MFKLFVLAIATFGLFAVGLAADSFGAQWYPFYGYRQPSYLSTGTCSTVTTQPAAAAQPGGAEVHTSNYWPSDTATADSGTVQRSTGGRWYPFYGNRRPAYLDR